MPHVHAIGRRSRPDGRSAQGVLQLALAASLLAASCAAPEPKALLRVSELETYWVLDPSRSQKLLLAPAVRFRVENISTETLITVDATATFTLEGSKEPWGAGFFRLTEGRKRLAPGAKVLVTMSSDARYSTEGAPESAFTNPTFKPVHVKYFLKVGSSVWVDFGEVDAENVIGSSDARALLAQPSEPLQPTPRPIQKEPQQ